MFIFRGNFDLIFVFIIVCVLCTAIAEEKKFKTKIMDCGIIHGECVFLSVLYTHSNGKKTEKENQNKNCTDQFVHETKG